MRKSSLNIMKNVIYQNKALHFVIPSLESTLFIKPSINKNILLSFQSINYRMRFCFSNDNKKRPIQANQKPQNQPQTQQYSSKHKQQMEPQERSQNAQMTPDGETPGEKQSPFVPTAFGNYIIGISCVALLLAYAVMEVQFMRAANNKKSAADGGKKVIAKGKALIGGDWELIGTDGKVISNKDFQGKYYLIYFGFCNCPDICPNSLMKLAKALEKVKKSSEGKFFNIQSVFVSVDPDRDTPQKIQKFAKYFDKTMIGVTGKNNQDPALKDCMKKFKIYSSKIEFEDEQSVIKGRKSYTIDHTILTYLMNPKNQYVTHIGANLGEHDIAKLIIQKLKEDQRASMQKLKI